MRKIEFDGVLQVLLKIKYEIKRDEIAVYAAQASFFLIISAVPLLSLIIAVAGLFLPSEIMGDDIKTLPSISLLSVSAVTTLWSAAKGFGALRRGLERVYQSGTAKNYFRRKLQALVNTLVFVVFIAAVVMLLLFGEELFAFTQGDNHKIISVLRLPVISMFLFVCFTVFYYLTAKGSDLVPGRIKPQLPGAVFASMGWIVFSEVYGIYLSVFPGATDIYGSLGALCLIMLWLWLSMNILILGAEINKLIATKVWIEES